MLLAGPKAGTWVRIQSQEFPPFNGMVAQIVEERDGVVYVMIPSWFLKGDLHAIETSFRSGLDGADQKS